MSQSEIENMDKKLHVTNSSLVTINFIIKKYAELYMKYYDALTNLVQAYEKEIHKKLLYHRT